MTLKNRNLFFFLLAFAFFKAAAQDTTPKPTPHWRPVYHFTPEQNWTNDPNGLIYLDGKFQLYYQHNPFENKWGHMSWGHAESTDLIHWKHLPVAIPEMVSKDTVVSIFSGSAVFDKNNTSGLGKNGKGPVVAIYTGDLPKQKRESQYIAYSNDNGITYTQYEGNPVIDLNRPDFRDPNVFWYEPKKKWIMAIAMVVEHQVRFYESANLKDWQKLSDFGPAGDLYGWECPALIPLPVDGNPNNIKYVLLVSYFNQGPKMQYFIGDFDGTTFTNSNPAKTMLRVDHGDAFYAAIPWHDAPQGKILLGWLVNGKPETYPWKGQMSIPRDLSLRTTQDGIRLFQEPAPVVTAQLGKTFGGKPTTKKNVTVKGRLDLSSANTNNACWIEAEIVPGQSAKAGFCVAVSKDGSKKVEIGYDAEKQELYVDSSKTESGKEPHHQHLTAPVNLKDGAIKLQILLDKSSLEVFANNGEKVITSMVYPDAGSTGLFAFATGTAEIKNLKIWNIKP